MSGWGEAGARGDWYANQNFCLRNLVVQKGEKLPPAWQVVQNARYLQTTYGERCITYKSQAKVGAPRRAHKDKDNEGKEEEWVPAHPVGAGKEKSRK